jgi:hypothetical protein
MSYSKYLNKLASACRLKVNVVRTVKRKLYLMRVAIRIKNLCSDKNTFRMHIKLIRIW